MPDEPPELTLPAFDVIEEVLFTIIFAKAKAYTIEGQITYLKKVTGVGNNPGENPEKILRALKVYFLDQVLYFPEE